MYYVYAYLRAKDNRPYYIGKGKGPRAYAKEHNVSVPNNKDQIVFWHENLSDDDAKSMEVFYISMFGRKDIGTGFLYNRTDGGDGTSGLQHSDEYKERLRQEAFGNNGNFGGGDPPMLGMKHSDSTIAKMSNAAQKRGNNGNHVASMKRWVVTDPDGNTLTLFGLRDFCKNNDIGYQNIVKRGHSKGWKARKVEG